MFVESHPTAIPANPAQDAAKPKLITNMKTSLTLLLSSLTALFLASCGTHYSDNVATISSERTQEPTGDLESQTLYHVNRYRAKKGLSKLQPHPGLAALALKHSQAMHKRDHMAHFNFAKRAKTAQKRYDMGAMSENLHRSWGFIPSGEFITKKWIDSPKHRDNMEGNYNYAGMAIVRDGDRLFTTLLLGQGVGANAPTGAPAPFLHF